MTLSESGSPLKISSVIQILVVRNRQTDKLKKIDAGTRLVKNCLFEIINLHLNSLWLQEPRSLTIKPTRQARHCIKLSNTYSFK